MESSFNYSSVTPASIMEEEAIRAAMETAKPAVCVIGAGGAGSNIVPWIKDMSMASGVLVHVCGGDDITLEEVTRAGELVTRSLPHEVRIVWGARIDPSLRGKARVMVVLTGVETNFVGASKQKAVEVPEQKPKRRWWG